MIKAFFSLLFKIINNCISRCLDELSVEQLASEAWTLSLWLLMMSFQMFYEPEI